jgi:hypothetical protein
MLTKLKPTRSEAKDDNIKILCDFDALVNERVGFKFKDKTYVVNNMSVENYMQLTLAYKKLVEMINARAEGEILDEEEIYQRYYNLINPLVPDFTFADLRSLPFILLNQLISLVLRQIAGDPALFDKETQKKNPLNQKI